MDGSDVVRTVNLSTALIIPLIALVFAVALLVTAFALYHLIRGIAALSQLKEQIREQEQERSAQNPNRPRPQAQSTVPDFGDDAEMRAAVVAARNGQPAPGGESEATTFAENADVNDEQAPISSSPYYNS